MAARLACVMYDRVVCVNEEIGDAVAWLGIPRQQLEIKPAFMPVSKVDSAIPEQIDRWMKRHPVFLSVTLSFRPEYGFGLLIDAMSRLNKRYPELGCLVMGSGEDRTAAEELIRVRRLGETVFLAGDLDHQLCLTAMSRSTAFVRPTFRDGDSISVREAMSMGVPVVASNVGTRPEGSLLFEAGNVEALIGQVEKPCPAGARGEKDNMLRKVRRLRVMPAEELWYRLREKYRLETDRIRFQSGIGLGRDREFEALLARYGASCKNYLHYGPARRFYLSTSQSGGHCSLRCRNISRMDRTGYL